MRSERSALFAWAVLVLLVAGCRSGGARAHRPDAREVSDAADFGTVIPAADATEREILARLPKLPENTPEVIGGSQVVAGPVYLAASGRRCRQVTIAAAATAKTGAASPRLACTDGEKWYLVPDVFGGTQVGPAAGSR